MMNSFWWGSRENGGQGGINWMRWGRLCMKKDVGGMGFHDLRGFNLALIRRGHRWRLGDGYGVRIWGEPWLRDDANLYIESPVIEPLTSISVRDLCIPGSVEWDLELLSDIFNSRDLREIGKIPLGIGRDTDTRIWHYDKRGVYTVKSAYRLYQDYMNERAENPIPGEWRALWNLRVPPKFKNLLWRLARGVVPNKSRLRGRHIDVPGECGVCSGEHEVDWHLYLTCPFATDCWSVAGLTHTVEDSMARQISFPGWLGDVMTRAAEPNRARIVAVLWSLWKERNRRVWRNEAFTAQTVVQLAEEGLHAWQQANAKDLGVRGNGRQECGS
ncbi:Putative ribonuclease H protein At1g65750 [Linum perenne]